MVRIRESDSLALRFWYSCSVGTLACLTHLTDLESNDLVEKNQISTPYTIGRTFRTLASGSNSFVNSNMEDFYDVLTRTVCVCMSM